MTAWRPEWCQQTLLLDPVQGDQTDAQIFGCL
jgi:hypothetical protein